MKLDNFPEDVRPHLIPAPSGDMVYRCLECGAEFDITELLYACPQCRRLFMLVDRNEARLKEKSISSSRSQRSNGLSAWFRHSFLPLRLVF